MWEKLCSSGSALQSRSVGTTHGSGTWSTAIDSGVPSSSSVRRARDPPIAVMMVLNGNPLAAYRSYGLTSLSAPQIEIDKVVDVGLSGNRIHPSGQATSGIGLARKTYQIKTCWYPLQSRTHAGAQSRAELIS